MLRIMIREFILFEFEEGHKDMGTTKRLSCVKDEGAVDPSRVTGEFKNFAWDTRTSAVKQDQFGL